MRSLYLLGGLRLQDEAGQVVTGRPAQRKRLAFLALLAAAPSHSLARDKLAVYLWPEAPAERARHQLATALYELRRAVGEDALLAAGDDVRLNPAALRVDLCEFEAAVAADELERATSLYNGPFLDGFFVSGVPEFERWVDAERERIARAYAGTLERLAASRSATGDAEGAAEAWRTRASLDPLDARVAHRLMQALEAAGDGAGAIRHAQVHAALLREELGAAPNPDVEAFAERLRTAPNAGVIAPEPELRTPEAGRARPEVDQGAAASAEGALSPRNGQPRQPAGLPRARRRVPVVTLAALTAVTTGAVLLAARSAPSQLGPREARLVLVAPLENRTGDPALETVGKIAVDFLTRGIAGSGLVEVIDPATALLFARDAAEDSPVKGHAVSVRAIMRETGATTVVRGSYHRHNDSLHFQVQVSDVVGGRLLAAFGPVSGSVAQPLSVLPELRDRTVGALGGVVDERVAELRGSAGPLPNYAAYRDYVEGLEGFQRQEYETAIPAFERAAARDSTFVLPLIWLGFSYGNSGRWDLRDSLMAELARRRDELSPVDRHGLDYFRAVARGDHRSGLRAVRHAAALAPRSNWTYMVGFLAWKLNRPHEAIAALETLDPDRGWMRGWMPYWSELTSSYHFAGDFERELRAAREGLARHPKSTTLAAAELRALAALGRLDEFETAVERGLLHNPASVIIPAYAGVALHRYGHAEQAREFFRRTISSARAMSPAARRNLYTRYGALASFYYMEDWDAARAELTAIATRVPRGTDPGWTLAWLTWSGVVAARTGDRAEAERILGELHSLRGTYPRFFGGVEYGSARIAAAAGDYGRALDLLREAMARGLYSVEPLPWGPHLDPEWAPLRGDPRYREIMRPEG